MPSVGSVLVAVMGIGEVHVGVDHGGVVVRMGVRPDVGGVVFVLMMFVVIVAVLVPDRRMLVLVGMVLAKKKRCRADHDEPRHGESGGQRLSQQKKGDECPDKWSRLKPCGSPGRADVAQGINEEDQARPVAERAEEEGGENERSGG